MRIGVEKNKTKQTNNNITYFEGNRNKTSSVSRKRLLFFYKILFDQKIQSVTELWSTDLGNQATLHASCHCEKALSDNPNEGFKGNTKDTNLSSFPATICLSLLWLAIQALFCQIHMKTNYSKPWGLSPLPKRWSKPCVDGPENVKKNDFSCVLPQRFFWLYQDWILQNKDGHLMIFTWQKSYFKR